MAKAKNQTPVAETPAEAVEPVEAIVTDEVHEDTPVIEEAPVEAPEAEAEVVEVETPAEAVAEPEVPTVEVKADVTVEETLYAEVTETQVYGNSHTVPWPSDPYGFTSEFKAAFTKTVSRMAGDAQKREVLDATIEVALKHLAVKFKRDHQERQERIAAGTV